MNKLSPEQKVALGIQHALRLARLDAAEGKPAPAELVVWRNTDDLVIHSAIKKQPRLTDEELLEWRKGFKEGGEERMPALLVTPDNEIVDGRHRYWCARQLGWKRVPVQVIPVEAVNSIIVQSLTNRRSYTKGQLAFILAPFVDLKANALSKAATQFGTVANSVRHQNGLTTDELAALIKTSSRIIQQALEIRELFATDKTKRTMTDRDDVTEKNVTLEEFFTPRILLAEDPEAPRTRPYGLGAVIAACHAIQKMEDRENPHTGGRPKDAEKQLQLFTNSLDGFVTKFEYWQKWEPETRQAALATVAPTVEKMPDALLAEFARTIKLEQKRRSPETK